VQRPVKPHEHGFEATDTKLTVEWKAAPLQTDTWIQMNNRNAVTAAVSHALGVFEVPTGNAILPDFPGS
jgi:hypothetical protein